MSIYGRKFYGTQYLSLFPSLLTRYTNSLGATPEQKAASDFKHRFFQQFCRLFGLVDIVREIQNKYGFNEEIFVKRSALAEQVFRLG